MIQTLFGTVEREPSLLEKLKSGVQKTRAGLVTALEDALQGKKEIDAGLLDELESTLISADIGVRTTDEILTRIRSRVERHQLNDAAELKGMIRTHLLEILEASERLPARVAEPPAVILVVGVNGSGKTTTIGKLAQRFRNEGRTVLLCAADTFRAAAIEQLEIWAERTGSPLIRQNVCHQPDPKVAAASSWSVPSSCSTGSTSRITNGTVTKMLASTMPGNPKMILKPRLFSTKPKIPAVPHSRINATPTTTGDTANGRSMMACRAALPRNLLRANTRAVGTPKMTLSGTTIATTSKDSCRADNAAGVVIDEKNAPTPGVKVRHRISPTGTTTSTRM